MCVKLFFFSLKGKRVSQVDIPEAGGPGVCVRGLLFQGGERRRVVVQTHATSPFLPEGLEGKKKRFFCVYVKVQVLYAIHS